MLKRKVGFIGLGNIGKQIALNLVERGFDLTVFDISIEPLEELRKLGAKVATNAKELAQGTDIIISVLRNQAQTEQALFGECGLWEGMKTGATLIITSTLSPRFVQELSQKAKGRDITVVDAAISGGGGKAAEQAAREGILSILVGGKEEALGEYRFLFEAMGENIFYAGEVGGGLVVKLINQTMLSINLFGAIEGIRLGVALHANPEFFLEAVKLSTGRSRVVEKWWDRYEPLIREYRKNSQGGALQTLLDKDVNLALEVAKEVGVKLPVLGLVSQLDAGEHLISSEIE